MTASRNQAATTSSGNHPRFSRTARASPQGHRGLDADDGWSCRPRAKTELRLAVAGMAVGLNRLGGQWGSHPRYGRQFEVDSYTTVLPATIQGIERYLGSGLIKGIGPKMAARIVEHFGADTLRVIEEEPGRLVEVPGLGPKRTALIGTAWEEQKAIKEVMVFLQGVGVSTSLAVRIYKRYGDASISVVRNEP